jgi:hypothetical protein
MMRKRTSFPVTMVVLALCSSFQGSGAQVIEERSGEANPSTAIFHSTLYGAGTGLLLGGAYALVEDDDDLDAIDILKWGFAGGAATGALVGLVYVVSRPDPEGDAEEVGMIQIENGAARFGAPTVKVVGRRDALGNKCGEFRLTLANATF